MNKWLQVLFCLTISIFLFFLVGCQGDEGLVGAKGVKGRKGPTGIDPQHATPADREIAVAVTNNSKKAIDGNKNMRLTFDQTVTGTHRDTLVANKMTNPPLIDGVDGEEPEWGPQRTRISMNYLTPDPGYQDPNIYVMTCRAAYDDDYMYFQFQWKEVQVTIKEDGKETVVASPTESKEMDEIFMDFSDTTFVTVRPQIVSIDTLICLPPPVGCIIDTIFGKDTTLIWRPTLSQSEDRMFVMFGNDEVEDWQDVAFREFFEFSGAGGATPEGFFADVWCWGAATSLPVSTADDWMVDQNGAVADVGAAPYIDNWKLPDSIPIYMNRRDPNFKVLGSAQVTYPFWYFDAASYSFKGWNRFRPVYIPGIVTTIPSNSRADVYAAAKFDNGLWILELKRARRTPYGDDAQF